ncbi:MAG: MFS transporter [Deltaproteobacteria bacterium]|nr:MFS transporter [Deltaproteobacteria bacterium]
MTRTERTYYVVTCLYRIAWASLGPTYALFLLSRGLDLLQINVVLATYLVTTCLFEIPTGAVADVCGRKASFVLSCVVRGIAFGMYYYSETFVAFLVAEFIDAIGTTLATGALDAWAVDGVRADGDKRPADRLFARAQIIGQASMIASGLLITLWSAHDIERAWLVGAAGFFACGIVGALIMREPPRRTPHGSAGPTSVPAMMREAIAAVREVPAMRGLCAMTLAMMFATIPAYHMWQPRLTELAGAGAALAAWVWVALSLASLAGSALIPRLVPRYGRARTLTAALLGRALLLGIAGAAGGFPLAASAFILQEMGFGFTEPVMQAWMNEHASAARRATMLSVRSMSFTLGGGTGLVVLGLLARATDIGLVWMVSAALLALTAPGFLLLGREKTFTAETRRRGEAPEV